MNGLAFGLNGGISAHNQLQRISFQNSLDLSARVGRPRSGRIQLHIRLPVLERSARLAHLLVSKRKVVMSIGVSRRQSQRGQITFDRIIDASGFIQHIAKIEMCQRVARINPQRLAIVIFGRTIVLPVVIKRAQVYVSRRMLRIKLQNAFISSNRLQLAPRIIFQRNSARKQFGNIGARWLLQSGYSG